MTRFLQAAFPNSYFIVVRRHPVAVSMSTQRMRLPGIIWKIKATSVHRLFEHWLHCHELFEQDKKYLNHVYELSYEDYIKDPVRVPSRNCRIYRHNCSGERGGRGNRSLQQEVFGPLVQAPDEICLQELLSVYCDKV